MDKDTFTLNNQTYSNNNNILLGIINELHQIANSSHENLTIKIINDVIIKMNFIINENKKTRELIMNQFTLLQNQISQLSQNFKINNINNQQELKGNKWRYVGQVVNGLREGKGIEYYNNGDRYEGDFRNDKREGKGIYYYNQEPFKGDRYEGDYRNDIAEGKGIYYFHNGKRYEGDFRNGKKEGKGIAYFNNGDRVMGDYYNDKPIGKHATLTRNDEVKTYNY